jgi:hypothetical protein
VSDFEVTGFSGRQGLSTSEDAAILLDDAERGAVVSARGADGCRRLVHVQGSGTLLVAVERSRALAGTTPVTFENDAVRRAVTVR